MLYASCYTYCTSNVRQKSGTFSALLVYAKSAPAVYIYSNFEVHLQYILSYQLVYFRYTPDIFYHYIYK